MTAVLLTSEPLELGEGARWVDGRLVLVDILSGRLLAHPGTAAAPLRVLAQLEVPLGAVAPVADRPGHWIAAAGDGIALLDDRGDVTWVDRPEARAHGATRMNDGCADPAGRFWAGSLAYDEESPLGSLYRVDSDGSVQLVWSGLPIANGPAFSADGSLLYLSDSVRGTVLRFPVSSAGDLGEPRVLWRAAEGSGVPDGLTVDDGGNVWVAVHGGSEVRRIAPDGTSTAVPVPARQPTSVCIAGDRLVVTSAAGGLTDPGPADGRLMQVALGATGPRPTAPPARPYCG